MKSVQKKHINEEQVLIWENEIIINGVFLGRGTVIGPLLLLLKSPPYAIATEIPGKAIGYGFSDEMIEKIEQAR
ncbi:LbetaH domain-containing protein [Marinilabilia rubra]|uniref:Uncharacterized protein n=1 Tax=Marinilabilia rubra TaxID=2162893 RepID=A0A2U2B3W9_9BACT|nr:hypothetical protein [Marinilabilia rubra]PWD97761.1 hypothetical protein DDZ16_19185 [Marinilabilia rubra]